MLQVDISFDDDALSKHSVSVSQTFNSPEEAISFLLKNLPFQMKKIGSVYVISAAPIAMPEARKKYILSGEVCSQFTGEALPYAQIQTSQGLIYTNEVGYFSLEKELNQPLRVQLNYLGFQSLDTMLHVGHHQLTLRPQHISLDEIVIATSPASMLMQSGKSSGETRLNHQIAQYMPGNADNSIFNLLRMMPGVRASGEPSEDLIVWGSDWGESRLTYDGFTIFGMKSFSDQIGSVNPYMAKDIRLAKGGFGASEGNRIGAIAEITGRTGNFNSPEVKASLSNYTANSYLSIPFQKKAALSVAFRQTFYNLYRTENIESSSSGSSHGKGNGSRQQTASDVYIEPDYDFRDLNVKWAGKTSANDHYYISFYAADDQFQFDVKQQDYSVEASEQNRQYGAAANYIRHWSNGSQTKFITSYSALSAAIDNVVGITNKLSSPPDVFHIDNSVQELSLKVEHHFRLSTRQQIQFGGEWKNYATACNDSSTSIGNGAFHITDHIAWGKLALSLGVRTDWVSTNQLFLQPRLSAQYSLTEELTATASFGRYHQFLTRTPYSYSSGSYQLIWNLSDSTYLSSTHYLLGMGFSKNAWLLSVEGYVRANENQLYFVDSEIYQRDNINRGVDVFVKKQWRAHTFFASYSLVHSSQPQATTGHELKLGAIYALQPFYLSANYVYGAGFPYLSTSAHGHGMGNGEQQHSNEQHADLSSEPYSRLDLSLSYKRQWKKIDLHAGLSVLNVFDTNNVKYSYRLSDQYNVYSIYTRATPFTPMAFLEIIF